MRIGIDCRTLPAPGREAAGIAHYTHELATRLPKTDRCHRFVFFVDRHALPLLKRELEGAKNVEFKFFHAHAFRKALPFVYSHMVLSALFERAKLDLLHGPANVVPMFYRRPFVVTVHDLAVYEHPEWFPPKLPGIGDFSARVIVPASVKKARRVIAVSEDTKAEVERLFGRAAADIDVVHHGVAVPAGVAAAEGKYCLFVGTLEPRKNVAVALDAFVGLARRDPRLFSGVDFVIAGAKGWKYGPIFEAIQHANAELAAMAKRHGLPARIRIRWVGYVSASEKFSLLRGCLAFIFPSLHEGFGLPVLEAMACGKPVVASNAGALPEICGDGAVLIDPKDERGLTAVLEKIILDPDFAAALGARGAARAAAFDWKKTAAATLDVYEKSV